MAYNINECISDCSVQEDQVLPQIVRERPLSIVLGLVAQNFVASILLSPQRKLVIKEVDVLFDTFVIG